MSGMIEKAKLKAEEVLHKHNNKNADNPESTNQGPHSSNLGNKADPRVDSDRDGSARHHNTGTGLGGNTYDSTSTGYGATNAEYGSSTVGPHGSNLANKADPRVDSDRDGRSGLGHSGAPAHHTTTGTGYNEPGLGSNTGYSSNTGYDDPRSTNDGPHRSNFANKLDPRVDSDRDGRNDPTSRQGGYGQTQDNHGQSGYAGTTGVGSTGAGYGQTGSAGYDSTNAGPHGSKFANKVDPRVDSDMDNRNNPTSRVGGYATQDQYGSNTGYGTGATTGYGNEPGIGHNTGAYGSSATPGSGNADKTAGPHDSNIMNKLDPRVDSDADGSKTYGGNRTNY